jgi:hypothetical protein
VNTLHTVPDPAAAEPKPGVTVAVINAGVSDPSSTRLLANQIAHKTVEELHDSGMQATVTVIDLGPIAVDIARSVVSGFPNETVQAAIERLAAADAIIASTPVYKAGISGLFKSFADLIDNDLSSQSQSSSPQLAGRPGTRWSWTNNFVHSSRSSAPSRCQPRCTPHPRTGDRQSSASELPARRRSSPYSSAAALLEKLPTAPGPATPISSLARRLALSDQSRTSTSPAT